MPCHRYLGKRSPSPLGNVTVVSPFAVSGIEVVWACQQREDPWAASIGCLVYALNECSMQIKGNSMKGACHRLLPAFELSSLTAITPGPNIRKMRSYNPAPYVLPYVDLI